MRWQKNDTRFSDLNAASKKVLIRCDGAPKIGFGHVVRCLALADELRDKHSCLVEFAMLQGPKGIGQVQAQGYMVYTPGDKTEDVYEGAWLQELVTKNKCQVLILDVRTELANTALLPIRASGILIVTIDDPSDRRLFADLAIYPPVPQVERLDWKGFTGKRYIGWDWVLLRPQFANAATRARARGALSIACSHSVDCQMTLIVTMGGSDPAMMTLISLKAIDRIERNLRVLVVLGTGFSHNESLFEWLESSSKDYEIYRDVSDMSGLMYKANLAVCSFGVTAYELAAMCVPAIYLCLTEDHVHSAEAFASAGLGLSLGLGRHVDSELLIDAILVVSCKKI